MFRIKICGVTSVEDGRLCADAGVDAIGLNFYQPSKRCVGEELAGRIVANLPGGMAKVGVFVNASASDVCRVFDTIPLDWIQLHGDEPPEYLGGLAGRPIIRALGCGPAGKESIARYLQACHELGRMPDALLIDAHAPHEFGGTGRTADWQALAGERGWLRGLPLILAGGLTAENVGEAIAAVRPDAVDTASGVESKVGVKDAARVREFVLAARAAMV